MKVQAGGELPFEWDIFDPGTLKSNRKIEIFDIQELLQMSSKGKMTCLDLTDSEFGDEIIFYLAAWLPEENQFSNLTQLILKNCKIKEQGVERLAQVLETSKKLEKVNVLDNELSLRGKSRLILAFLINQNLRLIELKFGDEVDEKLLREAFNQKGKFSIKRGDDEVFHISILNKENIQCMKKLSFLWKFIDCKGFNLSGSEGRMKIGHYNGTFDVVSSLKVCTSMEELNLDENAIDNGEIGELVNALKGNKTLKRLSLKGNQIGDSGAEELVEWFFQHPYLEELNLSKNCINDRGLSTFLGKFDPKMMFSKSIQLDFSDNKITGENLRNFLKIFNQKMTLSKPIRLDFSHNFIKESWIKLMMMMQKFHSGSESLFLIFFPQNGINVASWIEEGDFNIISGNNFQIGDEGAKVIARALENNHTVKVLNLMNNQIGDVGARALVEVLKSNRTLVSLNLRNNKISDFEKEALFEAFKESEGLKSLEL